MKSTLKDIIRFDFCRFQQQNQNLADLSSCGYKIMDLGKDAWNSRVFSWDHTETNAAWNINISARVKQYHSLRTLCLIHRS